MTVPVANRSVQLAAVRTVWGLLLLGVPDWVLAGVPGDESSPLTRTVARVLGVRHVAQGAAALAGSGLALGAWWVDAAHSASMLGLTLAKPAHRRLTGIDAALAAAFGTATRWAAHAGV